MRELEDLDRGLQEVIVMRREERTPALGIDHVAFQTVAPD